MKFQDKYQLAMIFVGLYSLVFLKACFAHDNVRFIHENVPFPHAKL